MANKKNSEQARCKDVFLFLVLIPFINALNYYLTYTHIQFDTHTLVTFLLDTVEGYAAWWGIRCVIIYLDKKMPYDANVLKRILVQLFFSSAIGLLIIILLTELENFVAKRTPVPASFYRYDILIFFIWFIVLNGIYVAIYYYNAMKRMEKLRLDDKKIRAEGFSVKDGRKNLIVEFDAITGFFCGRRLYSADYDRKKKIFIR